MDREANPHQLPPYASRPTSHFSPHSPTNGTRRQSPYDHYPSTAASLPMPSAMSPRLGPPPSPKLSGPIQNGSTFATRDPNGTAYFDPVTDQRGGESAWKQPHQPARSPIQVNCAFSDSSSPTTFITLANTNVHRVQSRDPGPGPFTGYYNDQIKSPHTYQHSGGVPFTQRSPTLPTLHTHPPRSSSTISQSPAHSIHDSPVQRQVNPNFTRANGSLERPPSQESLQPELQRQNNSSENQSPSKPTRTADPMAVSSILSSNTNDVPKPKTRSMPSSKQFKRSNGELATTTPPPRKPLPKPVPSNDYPGSARRSAKQEPDLGMKGHLATRGGAVLPSNGHKLTSTSDKENEKVAKEMAKIDAMEHSDVESSEWDDMKEKYLQSSRKRFLDVEEAETSKRKVKPSLFNFMFC